MSIFNCIKVELLKFKNSHIKFTIIIPFLLSIVMLLVDLFIRKESILSRYSPVIDDGFHSIVAENHLSLIWPIILMFAIIINSISIFYINIKNNSITNMLSSSISRTKYYISKIIIILFCTATLIIIENVGLVFIGYIFNLSGNIDIELMIRYGWMQFFCCLGIIGIQGLLFSITTKITTLISINIFIICMSILMLRFSFLTAIIPYLQIANSLPIVTDGQLILQSMCYSVLLFIIFNILSIFIFNKIDIKGE